jgi:hypothetical protein
LNESWDFLQFIAKAENVKPYLDSVKKPTALRSLIDKQAEDLDIAPFVNQLLTAKSWYKGVKPIAAEEIFKDMIRQNLAGALETKKIIQQGAMKINQTIK